MEIELKRTIVILCELKDIDIFKLLTSAINITYKLMYNESICNIDLEDIRKKVFTSKTQSIYIVLSNRFKISLFYLNEIEFFKKNISFFDSGMHFIKYFMDNILIKKDCPKININYRDDLLRDGMIVEFNNGKRGIVCHILLDKCIAFENEPIKIIKNFIDLNLNVIDDNLFKKDYIKIIYYTQKNTGFCNMIKNVTESDIIYCK